MYLLCLLLSFSITSVRFIHVVVYRINGKHPFSLLLNTLLVEHAMNFIHLNGSAHCFFFFSPPVSGYYKECCWTFLLSILSRSFTSMLLRLTCNFPFLWCSCQLLVSQLYWPHKIIGNIPSFSVFWMIFCKIHGFPLCLEKFTKKAVYDWNFLHGKV